MHRYLTIEEIKEVLCGMPHEKAPKPCGMTVEIMVHHWNTIKEDLIVVALHFFSHRHMLSTMNHTFLVLKPKRYFPTTLDDYRPISYVGVPYKIISKILANCLLIVFPNLNAGN